MADKKKQTSTPMTPKAAGRVQGHADRNNTNADFKARAQRAAAKNAQGGGEKK